MTVSPGGMTVDTYDASDPDREAVLIDSVVVENPFGNEAPASAPVAVIDPEVHAALIEQAGTATTVSKLRETLLALLDAIGPADSG